MTNIQLRMNTSVFNSFGCHVKNTLFFAFYIFKNTYKETVQDIDNCDKWHTNVLLY